MGQNERILRPKKLPKIFNILGSFFAFCIKFLNFGKNSLYKRRYINLNESKMKNIIVLKDLPSNIVDEAIVILKSGNKIKNTKKVETASYSKFEEAENSSYEIAIKEAEFLVQNYMKNLEKPKDDASGMKKLKSKYQKLKIYSFFLGAAALIRNCFSSFIIFLISLPYIYKKEFCK